MVPQNYPLVNVYITMENYNFSWVCQRTKCQFSIAMFVYQRAQGNSHAVPRKSQDKPKMYKPNVDIIWDEMGRSWRFRSSFFSSYMILHATVENWSLSTTSKREIVIGWGLHYCLINTKKIENYITTNINKPKNYNRSKQINFKSYMFHHYSDYQKSEIMTVKH